MKFRRIGVVGATLAISMAGLSTAAAADPAEDVAILVENLPAAGEALAEGLQDTVDTAVATTSAVETSEALGAGLVASGSTLVAGTEQFGALGLGFQLANQAVQTNLGPYLGAIDDPSTAGDLFNPDDLATLLENAPEAVDVATPYAMETLIAGLQGELGMASVGAVNATGNGLNTLLSDTNYRDAIQLVGVPLLVGVFATMEYIEQLEEASAPLFEAAAPVTDQIVAILEGV